MQQIKLNLLVKGHAFALCLWRRFPWFQHHQLPFLVKNSVFSLCWQVLILKRYLTFEPTSFGGKILTPQSIKGKERYFPPYFSLFPLIFFFLSPKPRILFEHQIMCVKRGLRSSSTKFSELAPSKSNKPLLGGDENPYIEEQWIISPFFEDYLFDKNLD